MKNLFLVSLFVAMFSVAAVSTSAQAQGQTEARAQTRARVALLSFDETKSKIEGLSSFLNQYKAQRSLLSDQIRAVNDAAFGKNEDQLAFALTDLGTSYIKVRNLRTSRDDLWVVLFALSENPGALSRSGWTDDQIEKARSWKGTFTETSNKIRKIDAQFPTDNQVEQVLRNSNLDVMFLLFAGLHSPAFILTTF